MKLFKDENSDEYTLVNYPKEEIEFFIEYMTQWYGDFWSVDFIKEHLDEFLSTYEDFELTTEARESYMVYLQNIESE